MIPIVNDRYRYILLYSAKVACTSLRKLYLQVHGDELTETQREQLRGYHNINEVQRYDPEKDYAGYTTIAISRNPYARVISAYLDQFVYARNARVKAMLEAVPAEPMPNNFVEFLRYLKTVPDELRDTHFQTQAFLPFTLTVVTKRCWRYWLPRKKNSQPFRIHYHGDISSYQTHFKWLYKRVFRRYPIKRDAAIAAVDAQAKTNSLFYSRKSYPQAATMSVKQLDELVFAPKPQDFLQNAEVVQLIQEIYAQDFSLFGYSLDSKPNKSPSKELASLPADFDWKMYRRLNPDLACEHIRNERSYIRHYLEYGRFEGPHRTWKLEAPAGFDWRRYLNIHDDLPAAGIKTEEAAIEHYLSWGISENRAI